MARRRLFNATYGTAKTERDKGGANLPPPMTAPPVPLPMQAQQQLPPEMQQVAQPPQGQGQGMAMGQGGSQLPPGIEEMIQQLIVRLGGSNG